MQVKLEETSWQVFKLELRTVFGEHPATQIIKLASYIGVEPLHCWQIVELARTNGALKGQLVTLFVVMNLNMRI